MPMTITRIHPDDVRVVPEWELCDRMTRSLRLIPFLTQAEIAHFIGVRQETVSRWLNGKSRPSRAVLMIWSDMTGADQQWLETGQAPEGHPGPDGGALYGIRDSNPEPADWEPRGLYVVNPRLTTDRRAGDRMDLHLGAVA